MNTYRIISKFECNGEKLVTAMMDNAVCVMPERKYEKIIEMEKRNKYRRQ